ncbi:UDP-N-acetylmuramoyl-L-alanine--D-glutamate ligase [Candidatus Uhrbacteria bacterium]|nr:UDP-N-acetylmuramoyl-L-alanine--D-glutamate ligase [Candidatus Uhrbacteria bacterium]
MSTPDFSKKKILIMGLGLHGGGVASAQWFFEQGAEVIVTDLKDEVALRDSVISLNKSTRAYRLAHPEKKFISPAYVLGTHREQDFRTADLIIQNPGVPRESAYLGYAKESGVPIENEVTIFFLLTPGTPKIAVTGTRGKSTTTSLIFEMVKQKYPDALLLGVAGHPASYAFLSAVDRTRRKEHADALIPCVMELSSWQLELFDTHALKPDIAVVTNIFKDHLNRYPDYEAYQRAKTSIFSFQDKDDCVILNYDNECTRFFGESGAHSRLYWFSLRERIARGCYQEEGKIFCSDGDKKEYGYLREDGVWVGAHMRQNALAACTAASLFGVSSDQIKHALAHFTGVPSRLECIGEKDARVWYDDTTSTSPEATSAALRTLGSCKKNIILIAGGADKNFDFSELASDIAGYCRSTVLLSGTATPKIASALGAQNYAGTIALANSMREAVMRAWRLSQRGDILLLSPAAASFGMFVNEFDRGSQFREAFNSFEEQ